MAVERHRARVGAENAQQTVEQRCLAGAVGPHEADRLARLDAEG